MSHEHTPLDDYAAEQEQAAYVENQAIARLNRTLRATLREREEELELVKKRLGIIEAMDAAQIEPPEWLTPPKRKGAKHVAIPSVMLNDIHWGEVVDPAEIAGVNKYNPAIAEQRVRRACEGTIKLCRDYMSGVDYEGLNVMLAGDLISGDIHDELRETNAEASTESVVGVLEVLVAGLRMLADHFGRVHVAAVVGNHGRTTRKPRAKRKARDSFDGLVYQLIARELHGDDRIAIQVATGSDLHFSVYNCVTPDTRVLTWDLRWVPAGSLRSGDKVMGFDENLNSGTGRGRTRRWRQAEVLSAATDLRETVRITLESGQEIICTPDHRWICGTSYGFANKWVRADSIRPGWTLRRWFTPWDTDTSREAGWLAGMFDGEGSLGRRHQRGTTRSPDGRAVIQPSITQNPGPVADLIRTLLTQTYGPGFQECARKKCHKYVLRGQFADNLSFIGSIRPIRLLREVQDFINDLAPHMNATGSERVVSVEPAGLREVVVMGTDTETYVAEGFGSHNTRYALTHGDQFRGGSGISGALAPLMLGTHRKRKRDAQAGHPWDVLCMGHWHQSIYHGDLIVGGSVVGYNEYAYNLNLPIEDPVSALWLTTPERGRTTYNPVHLMDRQAEGW